MIGVFHVGSKWFDHTEPYLTASSQEVQGVEGNCTHIPGGSPKLNLCEPPYRVSV